MIDTRDIMIKTMSEKYKWYLKSENERDMAYFNQLVRRGLGVPDHA